MCQKKWFEWGATRIFKIIGFFEAHLFIMSAKELQEKAAQGAILFY